MLELISVSVFVRRLSPFYLWFDCNAAWWACDVSAVCHLLYQPVWENWYLIKKIKRWRFYWLCNVVHVCYPLARVGLMHIGVFILLLLSGERNFGVRLNKPYSLHVPMDIPVFTGTHADLLIVVNHIHDLFYGSTWNIIHNKFSTYVYFV